MSHADYLPILIQICLAAGVAVTVIGASHLIGQRAAKNAIKDSPYECGVKAEGIVHTRFSVKFYVTAMLFILFDIEVVFLYPWAVNYTSMLKSHGSTIFWSMAGFLSLVTVGYVYAIRKGVLDWKKG